MKLVVLSIDALMMEDLPYLRSFRYLSSLLKGSFVCPVMGIYPTYTYPCHATVITGCCPDRTGIAHNQALDGRWLWERQNVKVPLLTDYAKAYGLTTAAVCWPCTGGAGIDYLVPELWAPEEGDDEEPVFKANCSHEGYLYYLSHRGLLDWMRTPGMDEFATECFVDIFRGHRPDISFLHLSRLDHSRHAHGAAPEKNLDAMKFIDSQVGRILTSIDLQDVTFAVLGDHGHRDTDSVFNLARALKDLGYDGRIIPHNAAFSSQVYLDGISKEEAGRVLEGLRESYPQHIDRVMSTEETERRYNLSGAFSFVLEAKGTTIFQGAADEPLVMAPVNGDFHYSLSSHGYAPEKGPFSPLVVTGMKAEERIDLCHLTDLAPTFLSFFGIKALGMDGVALNLSRV